MWFNFKLYHVLVTWNVPTVLQQLSLDSYSDSKKITYQIKNVVMNIYELRSIINIKVPELVGHKEKQWRIYYPWINVLVLN